MKAARLRWMRRKQQVPGSALSVSTAAGMIALLLGLASLLGGRERAPSGSNLVPSSGFGMSTYSALNFVFGGAALTLCKRPARWTRASCLGLAALVGVIAMLTLFQHLTAIGIDEWLPPHPRVTPGGLARRMPVVTASGFVFAAWALIELARRRGTAAPGSTAWLIGYALSALGAAIMLSKAIPLPLLGAGQDGGVPALPSAIGFLVLGFGIVASAVPSHPAALGLDARITSLATGLLAAAAIAVGMTTLAIMQREVQHTLSQGLAFALESRISEVNANVLLPTARAESVAARPDLIEDLQLLRAAPAATAQRRLLHVASQHLRNSGFSAIEIDTAAGENVAHAGRFVGTPVLDLSLDQAGNRRLLWKDGFVLRLRLPIEVDGMVLGTFLSDQPLPSLGAAIYRTHQSWRSAEFLLCQKRQAQTRCLAPETGHTPRVVATDTPRGTLLALPPNAVGNAHAVAFGDRPVVGVWGPVGELGLLGILQLDPAEVSLPLAAQFHLTLLLIALLAAVGAWLMRRTVQPMAKALQDRMSQHGVALEQATESLRRSERRFERAVESAPSALVMIGADGRIAMANDLAERMFGYPRAELLGKEVEILVPERFRGGHPAFRGSFHANPATRQMGAGRELFARRKDGTEFPVEIGLNPVDTDDGVGVGVISAIVDISERRNAQNQIERALREKTVLLDEIHHRVKNNLQVIASLLNLQAGSARNEAVRQVLAESQSRVKAMALIHQLLYERKDYSMVDLGEYVTRLAQLLMSTYRLQAQHVQLLPDVETIPVELQRAVPCGLLVNELLSNCLKHAFPDARAGKVSIALKRHGADEVVLTVSDDGVGLPPEVELGGGSSLGLQLVPLLAEQAGGRLALVRRPGTTFELTLSSLAAARSS